MMSRITLNLKKQARCGLSLCCLQMDGIIQTTPHSMPVAIENNPTLLISSSLEPDPSSYQLDTLHINDSSS